MLALSTVGVDRVGHGYHQGKLRHEERATPFHEFVLQTLQQIPKPLTVVPGPQPLATLSLTTRSTADG
ncbi:hypothetical protein C5F59_036945 [Streptomyces sp. QL37]|uniref:hypothetical protein n=1 Tax=Streptomyces sp. QL37 TaxID=2093747 RepID=UPI000CF1F68E|nr:hypothetical protein [Streptomyces sp. QL37]PPQ61727.1 hypothetical protein C5F59_37460 [Streptomyces sp. QL37]